MYLGFYTSGGRKFRPSGGTFGRLWNGPRSVPPCRRNCSFATGILRVFREIRETQVLVMVGRVGDIPRRGEQQQAIALEILDDLGIARELELLDVEVLLVILNPANVLIRQVFADDLNVILVLQTVLDDSNHEFLYCFFQSVQSQFSGLPPQLLSFS